MSFIEGIGDEVVQFFSILLIVLLAVAAWWSTSIRETPHSIRTVLILERRSRNRRNVEQVQTQSTGTGADNVIDTGQQDSTNRVDTEVLTNESQNKDVCTTSNPSIVESGAAPENLDTESSSTSGGTTSATAVQEFSAIKQDLKEEVTPLLQVPTVSLLSKDSNTVTTEQPIQDSDNIRIRLKYLNDDQKLVEGRLQEPLGEFKRRHFNIELSADKLVRLIFNGQVLASDQQTLEACGLFDNCVVHCLVHSQRTPARNTNTSQTIAAPPDGNLTALLYICTTLCLCIVWFCRYQYAQFFTWATTAALVGLTGIFIISIVSLYLTDQDGIPQ